MCSAMLRKKYHYAWSVERKSLTLMMILPNTRKKLSLLNLVETLLCKVNQILATILQ